MSTLNHLFDLPEQICYVQCGFCTTILLVSVPCSSLSMVVTVRCGHCTSLLSVNMMKASFVPLQLLATLGRDDEPKDVLSEEMVAPRKSSDRRSPSLMSSSDNGEEDIIRVNPTVNKPPEKRQRAPSAYNRFIKEEIRRLKAQNPNIPHKEAFSTAAKNWAQFPPTHKHNRGEKESYEQDDQGEASWNSEAAEVHIQGNDFRERKAARSSIGPSHPWSEVKNNEYFKPYN